MPRRAASTKKQCKARTHSDEQRRAITITLSCGYTSFLVGKRSVWSIESVYTSSAIPQTTSAWTMSVPQNSFLYQPETLGNEFSVLTWVLFLYCLPLYLRYTIYPETSWKPLTMVHSLPHPHQQSHQPSFPLLPLLIRHQRMSPHLLLPQHLHQK